MKNLFLTLVITIFSIISGLSQKHLLRYQGGKFAKCPIDGCGYLKNYKNGDLQETCDHEQYRLKYNNLNWASEYILLDPYDGLWVVPCNVKKNGKVFYKVYYFSENDHKIRKGTFEGSELEKMKVYKFKKRSHAKLFLKGKVCLTKSYR